MGIMSIGQYSRMVFSKLHFSWKQNVALMLCGAVLVYLVHKTNMDEIYKLSIVMVASLILHTLVGGILKGGERSEGKIAKKVSKNIDKLMD